ncbi:glycosyltransferase family protein [Neorhizobium alkalisoli]|uniref:Putative glycosyltransferase n=1 Tax=Neorhizobium alkalisoli TaxID=528178 RepID=A0A561R3E2_9HYPH|nr:glycosyltransferase [Neorhizobium alkalisoli]TWF57134.1 putative glycosyltransferase [Neorhizobium alkalisoli]
MSAATTSSLPYTSLPGAGRPVLFYVQHLLGIGHIVRASRVAQALQKAGFDVTLVTGGTPVRGFPPEGVKHVQLPPVVASNSGFSSLADENGKPVDKAFEERRTALLLETFHETNPVAVIIEAFPFGRRQVRFELLPLLSAVRQAPQKPLLLSSVRDILQENRKAGRDDETISLVNDHFDGVLVHGDERFVKLEETFPRASEFASKIHYTGLVAPRKPEPAADRFDMLVSAGGGAVGAGLITASLEAQRILGDRRSWCVITGPNLPAADFDHISASAPDNVTVIRFRPDFPSLLANAELSISQAGYNTVCDLLQTGCRPVLIPFATGGETEQTVRAEKLAGLGLAEVVTEAELSGEALAAAITRAAALKPAATLSLSLDGAEETAAILDRLLA